MRISRKDMKKELPKIDDIADAYWICTYFKELNNAARDQIEAHGNIQI